MPNKCCVPNCRSNYKSGQKNHVFKFPQHEEAQSAWIRAIPRADFNVSPHSRVCELHFIEADIVREVSHIDDLTGNTVTAPLSRLRLRPGAVPSKFPECPSYLSKPITSREHPDSKRMRLQAASLKKACEASAEAFRKEKEADKILNLEDLMQFITSKNSTFWHAIERKERLILLHITEDDAPCIKYSIAVKADLGMTVYFARTPITKVGIDSPVPTVANSKKAVMDLLESIENSSAYFPQCPESCNEDICKQILLLLEKLSFSPTDGSSNVIQFLSEQLKLLSMKKVRRRYSADFMIFCCLLFTVSPHAYKYIRGSGRMALPHPVTIRSICSSYGMSPQIEHQSESFLRYMAGRITDLNDRQRFVTLMVDEIHIKPYFDYKGGNITGAALNSSAAATSALVFMVQSILCQFKEVAHIVPVQRADAEDLHNLLRKVICGLEEIGYRVVCVVSDNNAINAKAMSHFSSPPSKQIVYAHPSNPRRPLFFVIDPVHILKCIRNNWLNQKNDQKCFYFPELKPDFIGKQQMLSASFATIRNLYNLESERLLSYGYSLSRKALCPSNIERQNVKLALQIFNDYLPQALRALGTKHNLLFFEGTATFIEIVVKWWKIVNVKTPSKGKRLLDKFQEPVHPNENDIKIDFLRNLLAWLEEWKSKNLDSGTLTRETHAAIDHTTYALVEFTKYCLEELKFSYVLLGKIQTDSLEERFGKYRMLAGSQYHVSIRQVYECENKLRLQSTLPAISKDERWDEFQTHTDHPRPSLNVVVTKDALSEIKEIVPVLVYVAGYAVYASLKKLNCSKCRDALTEKRLTSVSDSDGRYDLVKQLDRGGLVYPAIFAVNAVAHNYVVVKQLSAKEEFINLPNQRRLVTDLTLELLVSDDSSEFDACEDGHKCEFVLRHLLWCSTNILLRNYCCKMNDKILDANAKARKRKAETLRNKAAVSL
ncbi:uncharacterized protein [Dermacentor albipictus]|uniref:uncharacterized protein n=1 Tax=Dermacentor albipictus TaxID=60249 RepID=UPI0031FD23A5